MHTRIFSLIALALFGTAAQAQNQQVLGALNGFSRNDTQREVNRAIAILCPAAGRLAAQLQLDCNALVGGAFRGNEAVRGAINQLTPDNAPISANRALGAPSLGTRQAMPSGLSFFSKGEARSGGFNSGWTWANESPESAIWSVFGTFDARSSEREASANMDGFDSDSSGFLIGAERMLTESSRVGIAFRYRNADLDFSAGSGSQDMRDLGADLFYSVSGASPWYFNSLLSVGRRNTDQVRLTNYTLDAATVVAQAYRADFDTSLSGASATLGYAFNSAALMFDPYVAFEYQRQSVDGYDESASNPNASGGGWAIRADSQSNSSTKATLGARLSYAISGASAVFVPFIDLAFVNVLSQDDEATRLSFLGDISAVRERFLASNDEEDDSYGTASLGLSAQFSEGMSGFLRYSRHFSEDRFEQSGFYLGFRWDL
jgi:uncharacterized protein with beta-barrel porin domain